MIWLPPDVVEQLEHEADRAGDVETGGVLLGFEDGDQVQVLAQVGPGPGAIHERRRFVPDGTWQQQRIAWSYEQSGRIATYLGDWHSHPGGPPQPSLLDQLTMARIARHRAARVRHPLMIILAGGRGSWSLVGWRYGRWWLHPLAHRVAAAGAATPACA
ncbi:MAG: Mov34/MPN/PAD-1 family protein [Thermoleophilaceae bacterium]